ncbi:hypothetical protein FA15DRAFT_606222 [Coprinopsis marcescibilis]|uniref:CCHC-type domain-containing protein n=1 Tax=Coprinopsis marcescibilis TaxID=230819 RepID=A0A5C3KAW5_COPMA|nr:hypothetical protein FA15DRAFT_606222 [Coprinopsis marcescibilis]
MKTVLLKFHGVEDKDTQMSKDFVKDIQIIFGQSMDINNATKVEYFGDYLATNSPAKDWYEGLPSSGKQKWAEFLTAFKTQFPPLQVERELVRMEIVGNELGGMVPRGGVDIWTHIAFADCLMQLAKEAAIESTTECMWLVWDKFPATLKERVMGTHMSWMSLCAAIKVVDTAALKEVVERERRWEVAREQLESQHKEIVWQSALLEQQRNWVVADEDEQDDAGSTTMNAGQPAKPFKPRVQPLTTTPATAPMAGNLGRPRPPLMPVMEELRRATKELLALYPQQPATTGETEYRAQLGWWMEKHPGTKQATHTTGFLLSPWESPVCSGECFKCGETNHFRVQCTAPVERKLPPLEQWWRLHCNRVIGQEGHHGVWVCNW